MLQPGLRPAAPSLCGGGGEASPADEPTLAGPPQGRAPEESQRPLVLLVDDDPDSLTALELVLESLGVRIFKASSGEQALRMLSSREDEFALILMDVRMPGMDGYETASRIQGNARTRAIPIIFLTSSAQGETEVRAGYAHGAVDYLPKPFPAQMLRWKVAFFIEQFRARKAGVAGSRQLHRPEAPAHQDSREAPAPRRPPQASTDERPTTIDHILRTLFETTRAQYGAIEVSLYLLDPSSRQLELIHALGGSDKLAGKSRHVSMSWRLPLTDAVREAQPQWGSLSASSQGEVAALPLLIDDRVVGVLGLSFSQPHGFSVSEQALFTAVAHSCAQAIRQEWQEEDQLESEQAQTGSLSLQVLAAASQSLGTESLELASVFDAITSEVVRHLADGSALRLFSEQEQRLECVSLRHVSPKAQEELIQKLMNPPTAHTEGHQRTVSTGQPVFMPVISQEEMLAQAPPEHHPTLKRYPIHSLMLVPLWAHGRIIGTLDAVRHVQGRPFTRADLQLLEEFATMAALTIEAARGLRRKLLQKSLHQQLEFEQKLIGIVSHDLRTPLGAIVTAAGLLQATSGLDERQRKAVSRILSSSDRATHLIRDLLDFTQAHLGGGIPLKRQPMDLHAVLHEALAELRQASPGRQVLVETRGDGKGQWDSERINQMITNLVSNALAHGTPDEPVRVRVSGEADAIQLEVHNQGPPIPAELLSRIFHPLTRGEHSTRLSGRHIGLGLYIVREIVHSHGGSIEVTSSLEAGTTFVVHLPRT